MTRSARQDASESEPEDLPALDDLSLELEAQRAQRRQKQENAPKAPVPVHSPTNQPTIKTTGSLLDLEERAQHPLHVKAKVPSTPAQVDSFLHFQV